MQRNSVFANDNTKASVNERASMLSEHRMKYIDDMHKKILEKLDNTRYGLISSLDNKDTRMFSDLHKSINGALEHYYAHALSSDQTMPFEYALLRLSHYTSDPDFKSATNKYNAALVNGTINMIIEHVELNTLQAKEKVIRDSLAAANESQQSCRIL
jgi:hypothetical protein